VNARPATGRFFHRMRLEGGWATGQAVMEIGIGSAQPPLFTTGATTHGRFSSSLATGHGQQEHTPGLPGVDAPLPFLHLFDLAPSLLTSPLPSPGAEPRTVTVSQERAGFFLVATQRSHPRHAPARPPPSARTPTPGRPLVVSPAAPPLSSASSPPAEFGPALTARFRTLLFSQPSRPATGTCPLPTHHAASHPASTTGDLFT
jgi:hypothetical protein